MSMTIGERIRKIRKEKKLTLKEISEQTDLSIPFLSQLETNKCNATMVSLRKIADALQVHPGKLFETNSKPSMRHRAHYDYQDLSMGKAAAFTPLKITIDPHIESIDTVSHFGHEFIYILKGSLTLYYNNEYIELNTGQSYMYDASLPHNWLNRTDEPAEFIMVNESRI
ncbi:helix-turn-helix domain-containing protein [Macrococcoides canis]|uniref:helix-turn-helix domain-containing protein n=1 Tax=Macrococcoides canis TaxID=1855823 RepID=UPI0020B77205|nr:XRE family transcriptional regulator [Macrococcus canis]UTH00193.1 helix-turn-helix transcriptional regulator [Macrococcus canis]WBF52802.1 XRE family transcriptional regulator [Macrococcus canis]